MANRYEPNPNVGNKRIDPTNPLIAEDTNPDPITGEPGSHPVGTGLGAGGGALAGAAIGSVAGPKPVLPRRTALTRG